MSAQRPLRILTVSKPDRAPVQATDFVPLENGGALLLGDMPTERRREIQAALLEESRDRSNATIKYRDEKQRQEAARALLRDFSRRTGPAALATAGRLYVEHGELAREVLWRTWRPDWPVTRERLDELLETAGVPEGGRLL